MTIAVIICYAILLLAPASVLMFGLRFQKAVSTPGAKAGYHIDHAPDTPEAWRYIQTLAGKHYILSSIAMLICGIGFMLLMPYADFVSLLCCAGIALGVEAVVLLVGMTAVGMTLQNHFKLTSI
ncbi:MAG: hypothetical protein IKU38_05025 [Clostridia bacterium]|nr:hypothetical protein [Clostridia bacterium]